MTKPIDHATLCESTDVPAQAGLDYIGWKGWNETRPFGEPSAGDAQYFRRELRRARLSSCSLNVLEIGFGNGSFLAYCEAQGWRTVGTEMEAELVKTARQKGFTALDACDLARLPDRSFDLIALFDVLEHISPTDVVALLTQLRSKLKPKGCILARFPNADSWIGNVYQHGDPTHVNAIGYFKLGCLARESGLAVERFLPQARRGFHSGLLKGLHGLLLRPIAKIFAAALRLLYFPHIPVVLSTPNVVAILREDH